MKYIFIALIVVTVVCWYPRYDLFVKENFFDEHRSLVQAGFMTTVGCHKAANKMKVKYSMCEPKVQWRRWFLADDAKATNNQSDLPSY